MARKGTDFNAVIGLVLRCGVIISFAVTLLGSILLFSEGQLGTAEQLFGQQNHSVALSPLLQGLTSANPYTIIDFGLLILLATPTVRVLVSVFLFLDEKRYAFVVITATVLALLLFSTFILGPFLAGAG